MKETVLQDVYLDVESIYAYSVWCIRSLVPRPRPVFHGLQYENMGEGFICTAGQRTLDRTWEQGSCIPGYVSITSCPELA